jgi:hypothetical protein
MSLFGRDNSLICGCQLLFCSVWLDHILKFSKENFLLIFPFGILPNPSNKPNSILEVALSSFHHAYQGEGYVKQIVTVWIADIEVNNINY